MFYGLNKIIKFILPKRLFYRALIIVAAPTIILQIIIWIIYVLYIIKNYWPKSSEWCSKKNCIGDCKLSWNWWKHGNDNIPHARQTFTVTKTALEHHAGVNRPPLLLDPSETEKTLVSVPIDQAGKLPDGRTFEGIDDFKKLLLEDKEAFLQCLTEKMLVYALGRPVLFGDRILVRNIVGDLKKQPTMDTLIKAIVTSDAFYNKDQGEKK